VLTRPSLVNYLLDLIEDSRHTRHVDETVFHKPIVMTMGNAKRMHYFEQSPPFAHVRSSVKYLESKLKDIRRMLIGGSFDAYRASNDQVVHIDIVFNRHVRDLLCDLSNGSVLRLYLIHRKVESTKGTVKQMKEPCRYLSDQISQVIVKC
jgi:hypothetical protein